MRKGKDSTYNAQDFVAVSPIAVHDQHAHLRTSIPQTQRGVLRHNRSNQDEIQELTLELRLC